MAQFIIYIYGYHLIYGPIGLAIAAALGQGAQARQNALPRLGFQRFVPS